MEDNKIYVYITNKGRKYHFNLECNYLRGKTTTKIPLDIAKKSLDGACTICTQSMKKKEEKKINFEDRENKNKNYNNVNPKNDDSKKNNQEIMTPKEYNINNENNIDNNKFVIITNDEQGETKNSENEMKKTNFSPDIQKINKKEKNNVLLNNNNYKNDIPFMVGNINEIMPNNNYDKLPDENNKNKSNKKIKNNKNKNNKNLKNNENEKKYKNGSDNDNENNNFKNNKININYNSNDKNEDEKMYKEESENFIDSKEIQNEPINNINYLKENLTPIKNNNINNFYYDNSNRFRENKFVSGINWSGTDILLLDETNQSSKLLYLNKNLFKFNNNEDDISILSEKKSKDNNISNIEQNYIGKGNFKFKFEVKPIKEIVKPLKISVGFEIDYIDNTDINVVEEKNYKLNIEKNIKIGALYETLVVIRHFHIYKKTNTVHVLINISSGKFFVVGEDELEKRTSKQYLNASNSEILYLRSFNKILLSQIKDIRPIFKYNRNYLKIANININGFMLENNNNK